MGRKRKKKRKQNKKQHAKPENREIETGDDLPKAPQIRKYIYVPIPTKFFFLSIILLILISGAEIVHRIQVNMREARRQARMAKQRNRYQMTALTNRNRIPLTDQIGNLMIVRDQQLIYRQLPNQQSEHFTINAKGFRGQDWQSDKPDDLYRIFILGGSTTFGHSSSSDSMAIAPQLQKYLRQSTNLNVEVLNAGVIGYLSDQELSLFRHHLLQYQPDMIILYNGWNDFIDGSAKKRSKAGDYAHSWFFNEIDGLLEKQRTNSFNPLEYSSLYRGVKRKIERYEERSRMSQQSNMDYYQHNPKAIDNYKANLEHMAILAKHHGIQVLIAPQLEFMQFAKITDPIDAARIQRQIDLFSPGYDQFAPTEYPKYREAARQAARNTNVHFYNGKNIFAGENKGVFNDICHYTDKGYSIVAKSLGEQVRRILKQ